jgi:hypothetical protein
MSIRYTKEEFEKELKKLCDTYLTKAYDKGFDVGEERASHYGCNCDEDAGIEMGYDDAANEFIEIIEAFKTKDYDHACVLIQRLTGCIYTPSEFK